MSKEKIEFKPSEVFETLKNIILANDKIMKDDGVPVSISICGVHGIGKTTICKEVASELGRGYFKLNLAQLTEPSELQGFMLKELRVVKDKEESWVTENLLPHFIENGYKFTGDTKTISCPPDWVVNLKQNDILILDDFSRGNSLFSQAVMELVNGGEMIGWNLRNKNIQIILNENPDDGEYNTSSLDAAQTDRMLRINMVWSADDWAARAEKMKMDERLINFVLSVPELFKNEKQNGISASGGVSPRMMDKFFSLVGTIDDFEKHLDLVTLYASISVGPNVGNYFSNFIKKRLDKLPSVEKLIKEYDEKDAKTKLTECCGDSEKDPNNWKIGTAGILSMRLHNYVKFHHEKMTKDEIKKYGEILLHSSFGSDQKLLMVRNVLSLGRRFHMLAQDPRFMAHMTKKQ